MSAVPAPATREPSQPPTREALEAFVRELYQAYLDRSWDRVEAALVDEYQQVDERRGVWYRGAPAALVAEHRAEIEGAEAYDHRIEDVDVRLIADDVGVATYVWYADARWGGVDYHIRCPSTLVARHDGERWRAAVIHATPLEARDSEAEG